MAAPAPGDDAPWWRSGCRRSMGRVKSGMQQFWDELTLDEMSGALGDLGTFLPLLVGLVQAVDLDLGTTLLVTGAYNVITGALFGIPMPVQPMKTIAAVALAQPGALTLPQVLAAGIFVSACVLALGVLRLMGVATRLIPGCVIRGMQLGLGLALATKGFRQVWYTNSKGPPTRQWWSMEGLFLGLLALLFILLTVYPRDEEAPARRAAKEDGGDEELARMLAAEPAGATTGAASSGSQSRDSTLRAHSAADAVIDAAAAPLVRGICSLGDRAEAACGGSPCGGATPACRPPPGTRIPAALVLVVLGVVLTLATHPSVVHCITLGPSMPRLTVPSAQDWRVGILRAGLPQLSLTVFNSVISVSALAGQLFPDRAPRPSAVAASVGAMNLVGCWLGAMPACHGAGGLAAQVRFGARTGAAPILLGLIKISLALLFGSSLFALLHLFSTPLLGAMLVFAGVELAAVARKQSGQRGTAVMLLTAAVALAMSNVAIGAAAGLIAAYALAARDWVVGVGGSAGAECGGGGHSVLPRRA